MRTNIPEKLLKVADDIGEQGNVDLTRLAVLKKWFEKPERLSAFAVWIATRATSRKGKAGGAAAGLFREAKALLAGLEALPLQVLPLRRRPVRPLAPGIELLNENRLEYSPRQRV
jgi:hypothetical protein